MDLPHFFNQKGYIQNLARTIFKDKIFLNSSFEMDYKSSFIPEKTDFTLEAISTQFNPFEIPPNFEILESEIMPSDFLQTAAYLAESFSKHDISQIKKALMALKDFSLIDIPEVRNQLISMHFFDIFIELINLSKNLSGLDEQISISIELEQISQFSFMGILLMTQISDFSIYSFLQCNFIPVFLQNFYEYSRLSQKFGLYSLSNMIIQMPNETFGALSQNIFQKRMLISFFNQGQDQEMSNHNQPKLGYGTIFEIIDKESNESELQLSVFTLLSSICYRLSLLTINDELNQFELAITQRIFNPDNCYFDICQNQSSRRELFKAVYRLCINSIDVDKYIASNEIIFSKFTDLFRSEKSSDCELVLYLFSLLGERSNSPEVQQYLVSEIPWKSLLVKLRNNELAWYSLFFNLVDQFSQPHTIEYFFQKEVFSDLLHDFDQFSNISRIDILKLFVGIINRVPPEICFHFIQIGIMNLLFNLINYDDSSIINMILDTLHLINLNMIPNQQRPLILEKYEENDAISFFETLDIEYQPKVEALLTELGIIAQT